MLYYAIIQHVLIHNRYHRRCGLSGGAVRGTDRVPQQPVAIPSTQLPPAAPESHLPTCVSTLPPPPHSPEMRPYAPRTVRDVQESIILYAAAVYYVLYSIIIYYVLYLYYVFRNPARKLYFSERALRALTKRCPPVHRADPVRET